MRKRILALLLVLAMTAAMMPAAFAEVGFSNFVKTQTYKPGQFTDVKSSDWFEANVAEAYEYGLMVGNSDTTFNPGGNLTVAEAVTLVCRLYAAYHADPEEIPDSDPWYQSSFDYAAKKGIFQLANFTGFNANITRAEFVMLIAAALPDEAFAPVREYAEGSIPDVPAKASYHDTVYKLYNAGILSGSDYKGSFNPHSFITRAEVTTVILLTAIPTERAGGGKPVDPVEPEDPREGFKVGDIVEIKADEKTIFPGGDPIPEWMYSYYFKIMAVDENGKPHTAGGVNCVELGLQIPKKNGPKGTAEGYVYTWVDPAILNLVLAVEDIDPKLPNYGDIVEIKPDTTNIYPGGPAVETWMRSYYFKISALTDAMNYPILMGTTRCVQLGVSILKSSGVDGEPVGEPANLWVDPAILRVVKASTEPAPAPQPLPATVLQRGDIVEIKADATEYFPDGGSIPDWLRNCYFTIDGKAASRGGKECVFLTYWTEKKNGPDGKVSDSGPINSYIAKENVTLVKRQPWNDPTQYTVYIVKTGDTFWSIAQKELGDGNRYPEILKYNYFTEATSLDAGMMIKLPLPKKA